MISRLVGILPWRFLLKGDEGRGSGNILSMEKSRNAFGFRAFARITLQMAVCMCRPTVWNSCVKAYTIKQKQCMFSASFHMSKTFFSLSFPETEF